MFTSEQYRAKAAEYRAILAATPHSPKETSEFRNLEQSYTTLAENAEWMAVNPDKMIRPRKNHDNDIAHEERQVLQCLGAAVIMRWNTIPTKLQRDLFDSAQTAFDSRQTLKGQIARFLHEHKDDEQPWALATIRASSLAEKGADIDL
jgi:hypothetical protein